MTEPTPDRIEREIVVEAPVERVWRALTTADELAAWFGDSAEIDLRPGGKLRLGWSEYDASANGVVVEVDPPSRFSFRWEASADGGDAPPPSTLVEFTLTPVATGTAVAVVESGFASLPEEMRAQYYEGNQSGWESELGDLAAHLSDVG